MLKIFCLQNGLTPLHLCAQEDKVNVAAILVKNGAEVDSTTKVPPTHFFYANFTVQDDSFLTFSCQ
jgi:ankyrin repeat protein